MIVYAFFPVAVVEEMFARGYVLDRLMPEHPSTLRKALPAILLSSFLFTVWHLPAYLAGYGFSLLQVVVLLAGNVFLISAVLGIAYVRSKSRNIVGPVLVHFLLDAIPVIIALV
jgi:membrane protease YdiL (CAAX protease family)